MTDDDLGEFFRNPAVRPEPRQLIRRGLRDLGVAFTPRPIFPGNPESATTETPEPLPGIRAALKLKHAAERAIADCARCAREDGRSWGLIGEAMGYADDPQPGMASVAEHAFAALASDLGRGPSFAWTCPACDRTVIDRGPEQGHPEDAEEGHAEGCTRMAAAIAAYDAQWKDEDNG